MLCLDKNSQNGSADWLKGIRKNIWRKYFQRSVKSGEPLHNEYSAVYGHHIKDCMKAYCFICSKESTKRSLKQLKKLGFPKFSKIISEKDFQQFRSKYENNSKDQKIEI